MWHFRIPELTTTTKSLVFPKQQFPNCSLVGTTPPVSSTPFFPATVKRRNSFATSLPWLSLPHGYSIPTLKHCHSGWITTEQSWTIVKCRQTQTEIFPHMSSSNHSFPEFRKMSQSNRKQWMAWLWPSGQQQCAVEKEKKCTAPTAFSRCCCFETSESQYSNTFQTGKKLHSL